MERSRNAGTRVALETLKLSAVSLERSWLDVGNVIDVTSRYRANSGILTLALGTVGILFSLMGILEFVGSLLILGVAMAPIAGTVITDYFPMRRARPTPPRILRWC